MPDKVQVRYCNYCKQQKPLAHFVQPDSPICVTRRAIEMAHAKAAAKTINTGRSW